MEHVIPKWMNEADVTVEGWYISSNPVLYPKKKKFSEPHYLMKTPEGFVVRDSSKIPLGTDQSSRGRIFFGPIPWPDAQVLSELAKP